MARKINEKLIERMTNGDLVPMLKHLKTERKIFSLEVRQAGKAFVYYKKCKILDLGLNSYNIDKKYFDNNQKPDNIKDKLVNNPGLYFTETLSVVDKWLQQNKKDEFETQQNIAYENQDVNCRYIILDMEYNFSQNEIIIGNRVKKAGFDLLGIERLTGKIVFFEVKKGLNALTGKAGIKTHIEDFEECLYGKNKDVFRKNLISDIKNIIDNKNKLELLDNFNIPANLSCDDVELTFVFEPVSCDEIDYQKIYNAEYQKSGCTRKYQTIFVSKNNFKLK